MEPIKSSILSQFNGEELTGVAFKDQIRRKRLIAHLSATSEITINDIADSLNISVPKATELLNAIRDPQLRELLIVPFVPVSGRVDEQVARFDVVLGVTPAS